MSNIISVDAFNNKAAKHEEDTFIQEREHWDNLRNDLGYETILDLQDVGMMPLDKKIFKDKPYVVNYKCIKEMGATFDDVTWITFTAVAKNGTVGELWKAAETCYQQAKLAVGDWHTFIEDFNMEDDGSFSLVTGS
mgnify:CR=1 FL=1|tara:strand:+ start:242 stop:649 length:408 start_codon:yes stop_codon:yes gene_type:complete